MTTKTKNAVVVGVTADYLSSLQLASIKSISDVKNIEAELLAKTQEAFDEHNAMCDKDKKWKQPDSLNFTQVKMIIEKLLIIRQVNLCDIEINDNSQMLCVYVNEMVNKLMKNKYKAKIGLYVDAEQTISAIVDYLNPCATIAFTNEVLSKLKNAAEVSRCRDENLVPVGNGIFNYATKQLEPFDENKVFLSKTSVDYDPNATNIVIHNPDDNTDWDVDSWYNTLSDDAEVVELLRVYLPAALLRYNHRFNVAAFLLGERGCGGKGSLLEMWRALLGDGSHCSISIESFGKDFRLEPLIRSQAILVDENDVNAYVDKCAELKAVITNDVVTITRKFLPNISYQFKGFCVFCCNSVNRTSDKSDSFYRRQLYIPLTKCFTGHTRTYIKDDYLHREEVLRYVLKTALESNFDKIPVPQVCAELLEECKQVNDPVRQWWFEHKDLYVWDALPGAFLYDHFKAWFIENVPSGKQMGKNTFLRELEGIVATDGSGFIKTVFRTGTLMSKPEPLIHQYGLSKWENKVHKGCSIEQKCMPSDLAETYRGFVRQEVLSKDE